MPEQQSTQSLRFSCTYCPETGPGVCVRSVARSSGPDRPVYAHRTCAEEQGVPALYELLPAPKRSDRPTSGARTC
ncbi:hypothetical protein ACFT5C_25725 [Streptomyces sp. NPDC057116]|uniref:hypothetical protein n=1 Tax=Streptomyces sp. NPDC057116 TaxID=3346023 RepID=UPI00363229BA